jgi:hypothetical protein
MWHVTGALALGIEIYAHWIRRIQEDAVVGIALGYCVRQSSRRSLATVHNLDEGTSTILSWKMAVYDRGNV